MDDKAQPLDDRDFADDISVDEDIPVETETAAKDRRERNVLMKRLVKAVKTGEVGVDGGPLDQQRRIQEAAVLYQQQQQQQQQQQMMLLQMLQLQGVVPTVVGSGLPNGLAAQQPLLPNPQLLALQQQQQLQQQALGLSTAQVPVLQPIRFAPPPTNRPPVSLSLDTDSDFLSEYQCLLRQHIEVFETNENMKKKGKQGRNRPILLGQVGIQCRHCSKLPGSMQPRGTVYYSATLEGIYQACQNMAKTHFLTKECSLIPMVDKQKLKDLRTAANGKSAGRRYWCESLSSLGVYVDGDILRFKPLSSNEAAPPKEESREEEPTTSTEELAKGDDSLPTVEERKEATPVSFDEETMPIS